MPAIPVRQGLIPSRFLGTRLLLLSRDSRGLAVARRYRAANDSPPEGVLSQRQQADGKGNLHDNVRSSPRAWHGAWCWSKVTSLLEAAGHTVVTVDLPSLSRDTTPTSEAPPVDPSASPIAGSRTTDWPPPDDSGHFSRHPPPVQQAHRTTPLLLTKSRSIRPDQGIPSSRDSYRGLTHLRFCETAPGRIVDQQVLRITVET